MSSTLWLQDSEEELSMCSEELPDYDYDYDYDYDFVEKPSEDFFCPITLEVLREPFLTVCCGHHLSQEATNQLQENQKPCPLCKQSLQTVPDKYFERKVKELKVRCPKRNAGCGWVGELGNLDQHLSNGSVGGECQYVVVACPILCGECVQRRDLEGHKATDCPNRQFICVHCAYEATYQEIVEDHWPKCKKYPLECPNNCGERDIERQHLQNHLHFCPLEVIECEFDYAGCTEKVKRQKMQSHVDSSVKAHLQLVAAHAKLQEKRIEKQEKQMGALLTQVQRLESTLQSPPLVFTMTNFKRHKKDKAQWFSPPFYSHIGGYKMCISVKAKCRKVDYVSVYLHMMAGEYDDNLKWPFHGEVTVQLLNQIRNVDHYEKRLIWDDDYSSDNCKECFVQVQGEKQRGRGWGYSEFISYEMLTYSAGKDCQYLMNDCLKFQIEKVVVLSEL